MIVWVWSAKYIYILITDSRNFKYIAGCWQQVGTLQERCLLTIDFLSTSCFMEITKERDDEIWAITGMEAFK